MKKLLKIEHIVIVLLSLLALYIRLYVVNHIPTEQLYDFKTYYDVANNVYQGAGFTLGGYPIAFQGMGYSTMLGIWFKIFNNNTELLAKNLNVILSMMTIYMFYYLMHQISKNKKIIIFSTLVVMFLPQHILYCNTIGSEVLSAFLLTLVIAIQVTKIKWHVKYPILGIGVALLALTKPFFIAYPFLLALMEWIQHKNIKETLKYFGVVMAVMLLVIAPWTLRNYQKFGRLIPISYNSGFNLYINNNPHNIHGGWQSFDDIYKTPELQEKINQHLNNPLNSVKIASDIELDFKPQAKKWIFENPVEFLKLGVIRIHSTYFAGAWDLEYWTMNQYREELLKREDPYEVGRMFNFMKAVYDIILYTLSIFGLMYIILNFKDMVVSIFKKSLKPSFLSIVVFFNLSFASLVYFVYEGQPRYNFLVLFLLIVAAVDIMTTYQLKKNSK